MERHRSHRPASHRPVTRFCVLILLHSLVFVSVLFAPPQVFAEEREEPFTEDELERFIRDWPAFATAARADHGGFAPDRYLQQRGWQPERFIAIAGIVTEGLVALEREDQAEAVAAELEQRRRVILESADLTPQQRARLIASLDQTMDEVRGDHTVAEAEMVLIRRHRDRLRALINAVY